jgi:hypothetical protein
MCPQLVVVTTVCPFVEVPDCSSLLALSESIDEVDPVGPSSPHHLRWQDIDGNQQDDLERIAREIQDRYRRAIHTRRETPPISEYPTTDHPDVWRVLVKVNRLLLPCSRLTFP